MLDKNGISASVKAEPMFYEDGKDWRIVDLRPHGVDCIPLFAFGNFASVRPGAEMHVHPGHIEASLCIRGHVSYETDGATYPVLPGHVFISRPDEPHRRTYNPKGMMLYRLLFAIPKRGKTILGLSPGESASVAKSLLKQPLRLFHATPRLRAAFERLFATFNSEDSGFRKIEMRCAALELLLALVEAPSAPHRANMLPSQKIKVIARRMRENPQEDYPLKALAREAMCSHFTFTEKFKRETGLTPHAYLMDLRVRRARDDLARGGGCAAVVAAKWGFSSPQHMATAFRRILGITPRQARGPERQVEGEGPVIRAAPA